MALGDFKNVLPEGVESMTESEEQVSHGVKAVAVCLG